MVLPVVLLLILLACSAFFSGAETALFALSRHELRRFQRDRRASARLVAALMHRPRRLLLTLMVGNITVNMFIFATTLAIIRRVAGADSPWAPLIGLASPVMVVLFGEILPKGISIVLRAGVAVRTARLIRLCQIALTPVTFVLDLLFVGPTTRLLVGGRRVRREVTVEELGELIEMSTRQRIIDADENAMLGGAIHLHERKVRDIMVPRVDIVAFDVHGDPEALRQLMRRRHLPKIPVYDGEIDRTIGLIYAKDLFIFEVFPLRHLVKPVRFVPEVASLTQLLNHFRATKTQLAMVVDEYGGIVGLVTAEDVVEEIVGELSAGGETPDQPAWERVDEQTYRVSGRLSVRDWAEQFDLGRRDVRVSTLAGLILTHLGRLPAVGDRLRLGNLLLTVESQRGRRIEWVRLQLLDKGSSVTSSASDEGVV